MCVCVCSTLCVCVYVSGQTQFIYLCLYVYSIWYECMTAHAFAQHVYYNMIIPHTFYSKLLQKQLVSTKYSAQQIVKEVTAAVAASQGAQQQQQRHEDSDSEDDEEFGAASTYANYQPAKCMYIIICM